MINRSRTESRLVRFAGNFLLACVVLTGSLGATDDPQVGGRSSPPPGESAGPSRPEPLVVHVYLLAGQSNMEGYGVVSDLPSDLNATVPGAYIFLGAPRNDFVPATGEGVWSGLGPGFGTGATSTTQAVTRSGRFGPELTFGRRLRELRPDEDIAIIKYSRGGSSIDDRHAPYGTWDPHDARGEGPRRGINQYDHALATIARATTNADVNHDGTPDILVPAGIVWMQGETDGQSEVTSADYRANLAELMELLRAALRADDLPVVIGRISDSSVRKGTQPRVWPFGDAVRAAQHAFTDEDPRAEIVTSTDAYGYSDPYHYDSAGYLDLGRRFAEAMHALRPDDPRDATP